MSKYIGTKAVNLSTTSADVTGNADIDGNLTVGGNLTVSGTTITVDHATAQTVDLGDGDKIRLGADYELQLWSDGTTGQISGDINHTGSITTDGLTVDGNSTVNGVLTVDGTSNQDAPLRIDSSDAKAVILFDDSATTSTVEAGVNSNNFIINNDGLRFNIANNGNISFYDTSGNAKFFWDASAESLGIGTTSPAQTLDVAGNMAVSQGSNIYLTNNSGYSPRLTNSNDVNEMSIYTNNQERVRIGDTYKRAITLGNFGSSSGTYGIGQDGYDGVAYTWMYANAAYGASAVGLGFDNAGTITPALTVRNGGNVGIGTGSSPAEKLHIEGTNPKIRILNNSTSHSGVEWWNDYGGVDHANATINFNEGNANWEFILYRTDNQANYPYGNIDFYNGGSGSGSTPTLKMRINTAGHVTKPYQPTFTAYINTRTNWTATGLQRLPFDATLINQGSHFNTSTNRFTAPTSGRYQFNLSLNATGDIRVYIYKNGTAYHAGEYRSNPSATWEHCVIETIITLSANDYVEAYVNLTGTGNAWNGASSLWDHFSGHLIN